MSPPFRAEHCGSLKRPRHLIDARTKVENGEMSRAELEKIEETEVHRVIQMQQKLGFKAVTDGEFRRHMFYDGFFDNLEGMTLVKDPNPDIFMDYVPDIKAFKAEGFKGAETYLCTGKIKRVKPCYVPWFNGIAKEVAPEDVKCIKMTMAAPEWFHLRHSSEHAYSKDVYANDAEYFADIAKAYREEIAGLYEAGCRNIQIDDPLLAYFCAVPMLEGLKKVGTNSDKLLDDYIQLYNDCLSERKSDMNVGLHLCRGNFKDGVHFSEGGYDAIAVKLFNEINVDCYYLEYDTPRAGNFEPLSKIPKHKTVVLGLISSKLPALEDKKEIIGRIEEAAKILGDSKKERICLSPQCGFASHIEGNKITEEDVERKLALVAEIAKDVWGTTQ